MVTKSNINLIHDWGCNKDLSHQSAQYAELEWTGFKKPVT
jgi:hypothetical protein